MLYGYNGKILRINLTDGSIWSEEEDVKFYRKYIGGGGIGVYYVCSETKPGTDAFDPSNILVFSASVVTGVSIAGFSRHSVTSVSPLTGGVFDSEAGGFWGRELKAAGFDAVVVNGKSEKPVYIWIKDGKAEILDATGLWGLDTGDLQDMLYKRHEDEKLHVLSIGKAGENKVRFACIINDLHSAHGRGGLGAVMGAKNLKALAVRGTSMPKFADNETIKQFSRNFINTFKDYGSCNGLHLLGTSRSVTPMNEGGQLPTYNWKSGYFEGADHICSVSFKDKLLKSRGCYACPIQCKKTFDYGGRYEMDTRYGGPEYETLAALGAYTGISDFPTVAKAHELCNRFSLDTISTGAVIAFAMECVSKGLISSNDGLDIRFGNKEVLLPLINKIANREGIGDLLAEGSFRVSEKLGIEAKKIAVHVKGVEFPAHEPRVKRSLALAYAVSPIGPDHMASEHDPSCSPATPDIIADRLMELGIYERMDVDSLDNKKVIFYYYTQLAYSLLNCLDICMFCVAPTRVIGYQDIVQIVNAATGWNTSLWELLKVGERRLIMMREYNCKSGLSRFDDILPERMYEPLEDGINAGKRVDRETFNKALDLYYRIAGWDGNGIPLKSKIIELQI